MAFIITLAILDIIHLMLVQLVQNEKKHMLPRPSKAVHFDLQYFTVFSAYNSKTFFDVAFQL